MRSLAILGTLVVSGGASAGVLLEMQVEGGGANRTQARVALQGDKLRVDYTTEAIPDHTMIFDGTQMITFGGKSPTYVVLGPEEIKRQAQAMKESQAKLPPDAREKMAKEQNDEQGQLTFRRATGGDTVSGIACANYLELRDGEERGTACVASWKTAPVKKDDLRALSKFAAMMAKSEAPRKTLFFDPDEWPGLPVSMQTKDGRTVRLISVRRESIPESQFEPPSGYTKKAPSALR